MHHSGKENHNQVYVCLVVHVRLQLFCVTLELRRWQGELRLEGHAVEDCAVGCHWKLPITKELAELNVLPPATDSVLCKSDVVDATMCR